MSDSFDARKSRASAWFRELRDQIVAAFEALEDSQSEGPFAGQPAGRGLRSWVRGRQGQPIQPTGAVQRADLDLRASLYSNVVLAGGKGSGEVLEDQAAGRKAIIICLRIAPATDIGLDGMGECIHTRRGRDMGGQAGH